MIKNIDDLMESWKKDAQIDNTELGMESIRLSTLHAKYIDVYKHQKMREQKLKFDLSKLTKLKWRYYDGKLNGTEELDQLGWEPMREKYLRADIGTMIDGDSDVLEIKNKLAYTELFVDCCEKIIKEIHQRSFNLKNAIEFMKFTQGV